MPAVLIIDAEVQRRQVLGSFFIKNGYEAAGVPRGVDAAVVLRNHQPDLILIDQDVPLGGIKTAQIIRMNPRFQNIPILLGIAPGNRAQMSEVLQESLKAGVSGVLVRPYEPERLLAKACACLNVDGAAETGTAPLGANTSVEVRAQIRNLTELPTLSPAQQRVIAIMSCDDQEVDVDALVLTIQSDQGLTMRTMRIARSAYYGFTGNFIRSAITYLGMSRVRNIVQSATILEIFQGDKAGGGLDRKAFWEHSVACGLVMQRISRDTRQARHFTAGLLHDMGKLVLDFKFPEYSRAILKAVSEEKKSMYEIEQELIGISHAEIGQELCRHWQLPNEIAEGIAHHHAPSAAYRHKYLSSLIYLSSVLVRKMDIGTSGDLAPAEVADPYAKKLHVPDREVLAQAEEIRNEVAAIVSS